MNDEAFKQVILSSTGASDCFEIEIIQELWSGYGSIVRYGLRGSAIPSVVVKHICLPDKGNHPRGWNTDKGHQRKVRSYEVERHWYENYSADCDERCYSPRCYASDHHGRESLIVLEDLSASGYPFTKSRLSLPGIKTCIAWLAHFHATFMGVQARGLWKKGTYWHLDTRPDELAALDDLPLKKAAKAIDEKLNNTAFMSFVHGDAKLANFCFSQDGQKVAAVDFQYVGQGCGMKDLAYFIGSCLHEDECASYETELLDFYFSELHIALDRKDKALNFPALEADWRDLYPVAWTDFHRFIKGWSPGHWKINSYSEKLAREVIAKL
jgi:hypothetical protein